MTFVIDTVGDIELPDGTRCKGVILAVPADATPEQEAAAMRQAGKLWSERVTLRSVADAASERRTRQMTAELPADQREVLELKGMV